MRRFDIIAFDADDTLWHNERLFWDTQDKFVALLQGYHDKGWIEKRLHEIQIRNLNYFGYGIKGFTLSLIETAIELTEGRISGAEIQKIIKFSKEMIKAPVELLEGVRRTVRKLSTTHDLMIITKGDLLDQEGKIARSGLGGYFKHIEIVTEKNRAVYDKIFDKYNFNPDKFLMVGNSLKSDILPILAAGGQAVYIRYETTWEHELVDKAAFDGYNYEEIEHMGHLCELLNRLPEQA